MSRNAVAAKRRKHKIKEEDLQPGIASGLTVGVSLKEALSAHPVKPVRPLDERLGHMRDEGIGRVRFVAEPNDAVVHFPDGRSFQDVDVVVTAETKREMRAGYKCLRCHEPQETAFPFQCDLCGYPMKARQQLDIEMEFEDWNSTRHLGPSKPIGEYLDEQEVRVEKARFDAKIKAGKSRMRGLRRRAS